MGRIFITVIVVTSLVFQQIDGFGAGAPETKCTDMFPSHSGLQPEYRPPPYTVTASSNVYKLGETITVILQSPSSASFNGYIIAAKDIDTMTTIHGRFTNVASGKTLPCGASGAGAVTHSGPQPKFSLQFQWQPTINTTGNIVFIATVVESFITFWMNIVTPPIYPAAVITSTTSTKKSPVVPQTTNKIATTNPPTTAETTTKPPTTTETTTNPPTTAETTTKPPTTAGIKTKTTTIQSKVEPTWSKGKFTNIRGKNVIYRHIKIKDYQQL